MGSDVQCGTGVLFNVYPEFEDTLNRDFRLNINSPLLDLGDNTTIDTMGIDFDLDYQNRIYNNFVDFGAYEYFEPYIPPAITEQPLGAELCEGENLLLNIAASGTGPFSYQWQKDGQDIPNETTDMLVIISTEISDAGSYSCLVIGTQMDTLHSEFAIVTINPQVIPEVLLTPSETSICEGQHVDFAAWVVNGGSDPDYLWYLNGQLVAQDSASIRFDSLINGDLVHFKLTSSEQCANPSTVYSDTIQIDVSNYVDATLEIIGPDTIVCLGNEAVFKANFSNGGEQSAFQWFVNGAELLGQEDSIFSSTELLHNDLVYCELISSAQCISNNPTVSNAISVAVDSCNITATLIPFTSKYEINICPNPSEGTFFLETEGLLGDYNIQISDVAGKIYSEHLLHLIDDKNKTYLQISTPGLYFVKTYKQGFVNVQKLIIQ